MKIIHFAGIRLGASYPEWPEQARQIRRSLNELLIQLFERARAHQVDALISAGDLFDSNTVAVREVLTVTELCAAYPDTTLIVVPGNRDTWGPESVYHHLHNQTPANLKIVSPQSSMPTAALEGLWIYPVARDAASASLPSLAKISRSDDEGVHVAVVCSDIGRTKPGPEDGMVMVSPTVTQHRFDYLAMGDGGVAERVGQKERPACYAGTPSVHTGKGDYAALAWQVEFGGAAASAQKVELKGIVRKETALDVTGLSDEAAVAEKILTQGDEHTLMSVVLTGKRPADRPLLERAIARRCDGKLLALHLLDATELAAPESLRTDRPTVAALWDRYCAAQGNERAVWADALKLYASGVTDPAAWPEAPWAH